MKKRLRKKLSQQKEAKYLAKHFHHDNWRDYLVKEIPAPKKLSSLERLKWWGAGISYQQKRFNRKKLEK